jgi:hypothetical protein
METELTSLGSEHFDQKHITPKAGLVLNVLALPGNQESRFPQPLLNSK